MIRRLLTAWMLYFLSVMIGCDTETYIPSENTTHFEHVFLDQSQPKSARLQAGIALVDLKSGRNFLAARYWTDQRMVVQSVVDTLIQAKPQRAAHLLSALMAAAGGEEKLHFESQLIRLGNPAVVALMALAEDEVDWQTTMRLLDALGKLQSPQGVDVMRAHLAHENDWVRIAAAHALGNVGGDAARLALTHALRDTSDTVVAAALIGLGKIGDQRTTAACTHLLTHGNARIRAAAVSALGRIGGGRVRTSLELMVNDADRGVRFKAQQALQKMNRDVP